jgi:predicted CoA-binding protein
MTDLTPLLTDPATVVAVVGATDSPGKYGGIVYRNLKRRGLRVLAVNLHRRTVDGDPAYPDLAALPEEPTIVCLVVPPEAGLGVLEAADRLGHRRVWLQPGAASPQILEFLGRRGFAATVDSCIMVRAALAVR